MPSVQLDSGMNSGSVSAVVTKADGTIVDYGVVAFNHKDPYKVAKWEYETFGKVTPDTAIRCAKKTAPYIVAGVSAIAGLGFLLTRN